MFGQNPAIRDAQAQVSEQRAASSRRFLRPVFAAVTALAVGAPLVCCGNEVRFTIFAPNDDIPRDNWQLDIGLNNPAGGGKATATPPAGSSSADVADAGAEAIRDQLGINATTNGRTIIVSKHNQDPRFKWDPLAPEAHNWASFGGNSGGPSTGPFGVRKSTRRWTAVPAPPPSTNPEPQQRYYVRVDDSVSGVPDVSNAIEINVLDGHDEVLASQFVEVSDSTTQEELDKAIWSAFQDFPAGLGGWSILLEPEGLFFGNDLNEWMTGGGLEVIIHPGDPSSQMRLIVGSEETRHDPWVYADFNRDANVDHNDLLIWEANFGVAAAGHEGGDFDLDGDTDGADFLALQRELTRGPLLLGAPSVPEPSSFCLAMCGAFALFRVRRARTNRSCWP